MKEHRAILLPTLWVRFGYLQALTKKMVLTDEEKRLADPQILAALDQVPRIDPRIAARSISNQAVQNLGKLWAAGVTIALGTDAGNIGTLHGPSVFREAHLEAEAGLTPLQVLRTATTNGAKVLGLEAELGDVAAGKLADLVVLDADPTASVDNLSKASTVIRGGRVFHPADLMSSIR